MPRRWPKSGSGLQRAKSTLRDDVEDGTAGWVNARGWSRTAPALCTNPMDEIDRKLLDLLQADATPSMAQLADAVGLSTTPCWKRVQRLHATGVITGQVALVAPERVGIGISVFVEIVAADHTPAWRDRFVDTVTSLPEVMEVWRMAGEVDYLLRVAAGSMAEFDGFYKRLTDAVPMRTVTSRFAMEAIKHTTAYPLHPSAFRDRRAAGEEA